MALNRSVLHFLFGSAGAALLLVDVWTSDAFQMEGIYVVIAILLLAWFAVARPLQKRTPVGLYRILLGAVLGLLLFQLAMLCLISFGIGFTGRSWPWTVLLAWGINQVLIGLVVAEMVLGTRKRMAT